MGRDKALLPHPAGGCWLDHSLRQLAALGAPLTLLSGHDSHLCRASQLAASLAVPLELLHEPSPPQGPLIALGRLMRHHPNQLLLLCPVDMPALTGAALHQLLAAASVEPALIHLAHDGRRLQPLLGLYPSSAAIRSSLAAAVAAGERRLQGWLETQPCRSVSLDPVALCNVNRPEELDPQFRPLPDPAPAPAPA
jgi:molybdopterin-guanine dinucleotide biosynthesis protein A